jgi:hypothetical protein
VSHIKTQKELVVGYHGECLDGTVAAFSAYECFGDKAEYRPLLHRNPPPTDLEGRDLMLLDFAFPSRVLDEFRSNSLTILDHHDTLINELKGRPGVVIDLERSGAGIAWDQLHSAESRPRLISYIEDVTKSEKPATGYTNKKYKFLEINKKRSNSLIRLPFA